MERVQVIAIIISLIFLAYVMWQIKKGALREEYAFIWILSNFAFIFLSVWRNALEVLARLFGIIAAPNLLFTGAIFAILVYLLHLSLSVSKLQFQNKTLAQEIALLKEKVDQKGEGRMNELSLARREMNAFTNYLLGENADESSMQLFEKALQHEATQLNDKEIRLLEFMLRNRWSIGCIDAAMGMFYHNHNLRKRMTIAFAILETNPLYFSFFQPKQFSFAYIFNLAASAIGEGFRALTGRFILLFF